jgi:hypothetical protein
MKSFLFFFLFFCSINGSIYAQTNVVSAGSRSIGAGPSSCSSILNPIEIMEVNNTDFANGTYYYTIILPAGFEIVNSDATSIGVSYISTIPARNINYTPMFIEAGGKKIGIEFTYTIVATGDDKGKFRITGLNIAATEPGHEGHIIRGGNAVQAGNMPENKQIHASLSSTTDLFLRITELEYAVDVAVDLSTSIREGVTQSSITLTPESSAREFCAYKANVYVEQNNSLGGGGDRYRVYRSRDTAYTSFYDRNYFLFGHTQGEGDCSFIGQKRTIEGCVFQSLPVTITEKRLPVKPTWNEGADTTFYPYEDPRTLIGEYVTYSEVELVENSILGYAVNKYPYRGVFRPDMNNYLFIPSIAGVGAFPITYVTKNINGCTQRYNFKNNIHVNDPTNPLPPFVRSNKLPAYCVDGEAFYVWAEAPDIINENILYIRIGETEQFFNNGLERKVSDSVLIVPSNYGNALVFVHMYTLNKAIPKLEEYTGYITLFPKRNPQLLGLPVSLKDSSIVELCSNSKDTLVMRPMPIGGAYRIYIDTTGTYETFNGLLGTIPLKESYARAFTPEYLFKTIVNKRLDAKIKVVYRYPGIGGACPDSVTKILSYSQPVAVKAHRLSPISDTICYGDTVRYNIQNFRPGMNDKFSWSFGDGITFESDTNDYRSYVYNRPGRFFIRFQTILSTLDSGYCNNDELDTIWVGAKPKTSFGVANLYAEDSMLLFSTSQVLVNNTFSPVDSINRWEWSTGTGVHYTDTVSGMRKHLYTTAAQQPYSVRLITTSGWGCTDTLIRRIPIFPKIMVGKLHQETFNSSQVSGWYESGMYGLPLHKSSWSNTSVAATRRIQPQVSGNDFWITNKARTPVVFPVGYYNLEHSWVESPAFDLSTCDYPMIGMDTWCHSDNLFDGASLQYTLVNDTTWFGEELWTTIGVAGQGQGWYDYNTVLSQPGGNYNAWSGEKDRTWKRSSYEIDFIKDSLKQLADLGQEHWVRFRVVFASNADNTPGKAFDGFAFDNFFLANRNRRVLAEQFVNVQRQDTTIQSIVNDPQAAVISYYVGHAAPDPINRINKADPSARSLLYGIDQIPRVVLDGVSTSNTTSFETWGTSAFNERKLTPSAFLVAVQAQRLPDGQLKVDVTAMKDTNLQVAGPFLLKVVVVEDSIQLQGSSRSYYNIMRKMLPDAVGTRYEDWNEGESNTVSYSWNPFAAPMSGYTLVAFIQDENTKEIYQAGIAKLSYAEASQLDIAANMEVSTSFRKKLEEIVLFPNPSSGELNVLFNHITEEEYYWEIKNHFGIPVKDGMFSAGTNMEILNAADLPVGMYQLMVTGSDFSSMQKFMIVK